MALFQNFPDTANRGGPHVDPMQSVAPQAAPRQLLAQGFSSPAQQQKSSGGGGGGRSASFGKGLLEGLPEMGPGMGGGAAGGEAGAGAAAGGLGELAAIPPVPV